MSLDPRDPAHQARVAKIRRLRDDFPFFAAQCLQIRTKQGLFKPFVLNRAQHYIHSCIEAQRATTGRVRALILKGRQQGACFSPETRILTADYRWVKIADIEPGDQLVAVEEHAPGKTSIGRKATRKMRTARVEAKVELKSPCLEILLDNGAKLTLTPDHRMLSKQRGGDLQMWRRAGDFKAGDHIRALTRPPDSYAPSYEDGWFGGIIDGEGSLRKNGCKRISVSQVSGLVLDRMREYLTCRGIEFCEVVDRRPSSKFGTKEVFRLDIHRMPYIIELLSKTRPSRFINLNLHEGQELPGKGAHRAGILPWAKIVSIRHMPSQRVIDLQTSEKTFIAEGLVSHNSTYVGGRYFHNTVFHPGTTTFILSHQAKTTGALFDMVKNFYDLMPPVLAPELDASNQNQIKFAKIKSEYTVGTAGSEEIGRGLTIKNLHCSEAAKYSRTDQLETGLFQAVFDGPGTEIIIESTAAGMNNMFYRKCMDAMAGKGEYILIFVPWFWQDEYATPTPDEFNLTAEEAKLKNIYHLTNEQLYWRRNKILSFDGDDWKFKQEYPMNPMEAFVVSGDSFFKPNLVMEARKTTLVEANAPAIGGLDCARTNDRIALVIRRGREVLPAIVIEVTAEDDISVVVAHRCARLIEKYNLVKLFIDYGSGYGIIDILRNAGYRQIVQGVYFQQKSSKPIYANKRSEMYHEARDWLEDGPCSLPDDEDFTSDLLIIPQAKDTTGSKKIIEKKSVIKSLYGKSTDLGDAFILTFAFPVAATASKNGPTRRVDNSTVVKKQRSELTTLNRLRQSSQTQSSITVRADF